MEDRKVVYLRLEMSPGAPGYDTESLCRFLVENICNSAVVAEDLDDLVEYEIEEGNNRVSH